MDYVVSETKSLHICRFHWILPQFYSVLEFLKLEQLKVKLLHTAELISGEKSRLAINKDVQTVELQISKSGSCRIEESDYYKRKREPKLWEQDRRGDVKLVNLFKQAEELARRDAWFVAGNSTVRDMYVTTQGNWVAVSGQAGIGKTTLTKQLVEKVLNKEMPDIDFLFYVSLKKVNYDEKMNALQFLLTNLDSSWKHDTVSDNKILEQLEKSEKVMIIFDGLDEATIELENQCPNAKLYDITTPEVLLKNILNGNILRKAKKLITSRPRQLLELEEQYRPHCVVDVLGINLEAQRQICKNICGNNSKEVFVELLNHPELLSQCYIPIICIFTIYWLHQKQQDSYQRVIYSASVTNVILNVLETFAKHGIAKCEFELEKLSKLAWEGLRFKKYEFSEKEIKKTQMTKESLNTILTTGTKANTQLRLLHVEKITYFSHLILQEFFSAVCLILFVSFSDFKDVLSDNFEKFGNLDVVKKFIFGLCNVNTYDRLTDLQLTLFSVNSDFDRKKLFLEQFVCNISKSLSSSDFLKCLEICSLLYEMQDQQLTKKVVENFPEELQMCDNIFPHDVGNLCYVLQERIKFMVLEINEPTFVGDSCRRFMDKIAGMPECLKVSIDEFKVIKFTILKQLIQIFSFVGIGRIRHCNLKRLLIACFHALKKRFGLLD